MKNFISPSKRPFIFYALLFFASFLFGQTTWTVNNNPNVSTDFTDLQAAINDGSVMNGDILYVQHSPTTYGNVTLSKELTIIGRSHKDFGYQSFIGTLSIANGASNSTLKGIDINAVNEAGSGSTIDALSFLDNDINSFDLGNGHTFTNLLIQGNVHRGTFNIRTNTNVVTITNNLIFSSSLSFFMVDTLFLSNNVFKRTTGTSFNNNTNSQLMISNNIFVTNSASNRTSLLNRTGTGTVLVHDCVTYNYGAGSYDFETDTYISIDPSVQENTNPLFTTINTGVSISVAGTGNDYDPLNDILTLQGGSPVNDDGLYETYNFINLGIPTGYPSVKITTHDPNVPKSGTLSVTIEAKTN